MSESSDPAGDNLEAALEGAVGGDDAWLNVPDLADHLGTEMSRVRRLLDDRAIIGVRRGQPKVMQVPRALVDPEPLVSLPGTLTVLSDAGLTDGQALLWLFTREDALGEAPIAVLRSGKIAPVRRAAQILLI